MTNCKHYSKGNVKTCLTNYTFSSEYSNAFKRTTYSIYKERFEVPVPCGRLGVSQECYERGNQLLPQKSRIQSTYWYDHKPCERLQNQLQNTPKPASKPQHDYVDVDVNNCGYEKYLDIYATTKALDHRSFSPNEVKHDSITVWDWLQIPKIRGRTIALDIPIPKHDLDRISKTNQPKANHFVPNRGLVSEYQEEFTRQSLSKP